MTIEGTAAGPRLVEAAEQLRLARHYLVRRERDEAALVLAEAQRIYKLIAQRGGHEAAQAEAGLEACRRLLDGLR